MSCQSSTSGAPTAFLVKLRGLGTGLAWLHAEHCSLVMPYVSFAVWSHVYVYLRFWIGL